MAGDETGGGKAQRREAKKCPCFVDLYWIPISGSSGTGMFGALGKLFVSNPENRDLYHAALRIQLEDCSVYVIELEDYIDDEDERKAKGVVVDGEFDFIPLKNTYSIRRWRDGTIDDEGSAPPPTRMSTDCVVAQKVYDQAAKVPPNDYWSNDPKWGESRWTSNSVVAWILQSAGLNVWPCPTPPNGLAPGWSAGLIEAGGHI